ncbi:hypothetical protein H9X78_04835, partial [Clostridium saudiense]|nr:hypothetical protein [Clostridium saudiense]
MLVEGFVLEFPLLISAEIANPTKVVIKGSTIQNILSVKINNMKAAITPIA